MSEKITSDAFKQKKGDLRHYAEAVEVCLNANEDDIVHIENYGDISTLTTSIEVKDLRSSITLGSYQIWNTLKNWVVDFQFFNQFDKLLLLTTSPIITDDSIQKWNSLKKEDKLKELIEASKKIKKRANASKEKIELFNKVLVYTENYTETDLLDILDKFHICLSRVSSKQKYEELEELSVFKLHTKATIRTMIAGVVNFIFRKGLEGESKWEIHISELNRVLTRMASNSKRKLPKLLKQYDHISIEDYKEARFVNEMRKIEMYADEIEGAIGDYCRTHDSIIDLLDENSLYNNDIEDYRKKKLFRYLNGNKRLANLESGNRINRSRKNFLNCLYKMELIDLELIENEPFFQRGNIHAIVDEGLYKWLLDEN